MCTIENRAGIDFRLPVLGNPDSKDSYHTLIAVLYE